MPLTPGTRLGHYEIVSPLGAGGMGEVYRARDTQLDRDVALKILPESFANDPDRLMRFTREAKTLASLNHPNIAAIYGIAESALVMELVEGQDLSEIIGPERGAERAEGQRMGVGPHSQLKGRGLPLSDALPIAKQIADALEAAHEAGIIHRDLKPANIKVRADGTVKVLDFGLAKAMDPNVGRGFSRAEDGAPGGTPYVPSSAATMTSPAMTAMGLILGTAAYMSPEQARGKPVDKRADIWAFGVVLYEMLTGITLFAGETVSDVLAAVLRADIDLAKLPPDVPPGLRHLLSRCLEKDPRRRLRDIGEARVLLDAPSASEPMTAAVPLRSSRPLLPWAIATTAVLGFAAYVAFTRPWVPAEIASPLRVRMEAGFTGTLASGLENLLAISPDGRTLVFTVGSSAGGSFGGNTNLYLRRLDQADATLLKGTEGAVSPFFSPRGDWLGYFSKGKMFKVPVGGGAAVPVTDAPMARGAFWGDDDVITFNPVAAPGVGLKRVSANGGTPTDLGPMAATHATQRWPQVLPGNHTVLYTGATSVDNFDDACLVLQALAGGPPKVLQCGGSYWTYVNSGHVLYMHAGSIFAAPFDLATLTVTGIGVPIVEGVRWGAASGAAQFAIARDGRMVYLASETNASQKDSPIDIVDRQGKVARLEGAPVNWHAIAFSPDGTQLAIDAVSPNGRNIWRYDLSRGASQRTTFGDVGDTRPIWMGNRYVTFATAISGPPNLYNQDVDGGKPERLTQSTRVQYPGSWSPDGKKLAFTEIRDGQGDVMMLPVGGTPIPFIASDSRESHPAFSPDGRWLAFASNESSVLQVYVTSATDPTRKVPVSIDGGSQPMWSLSSSELVFRTEESSSRIFFVTYDPKADTFRPSRPALWTTARFGLRSGVGDVALHPDGKRMAGTLASAVEAAPNEPHIMLVTDFFEELRRRVARK